MPESAARRRSENAAAERRKARRPASLAGGLRRSEDRPCREAGHEVRRFRTGACRRSAPLASFRGGGKRTGAPAPLSNGPAQRWLKPAQKAYSSVHGRIPEQGEHHGLQADLPASALATRPIGEIAPGGEARKPARALEKAKSAARGGRASAWRERAFRGRAE